MSDGWAPDAWRTVAAELDRWAEVGRTAPLWWRDDDAGRPDPALTRLIALARATGLPLGLAVVPTWLVPETAAELAAAPAAVRVLQHGAAHADHESPASGRRRAAELGAAREATAVVAELVAARARLEPLVGPRALRVLVPPWNRIAPEVIARLPAAGYVGLSTFGRQPTPGPGLRQVNCHVDPILWREGKRFTGAAAVLDGLRGELTARRTAPVTPAEPIGLLTHHRDLSAAGWAFVETLLARLALHPAVAFPSLSALFGAYPASRS